MGEYFRFRIQLAGVKPPIYRRFLITTKASFFHLHDAIQAACGWENAHLFTFRATAAPDSASLAAMPGDPGWGPDAKRVALAKWFSLTGNRVCVYEYDFGDAWLHEVTLETIEQHDGPWKRRLLDGARAFPPEDCGGLGGYKRCLQAVAGNDDPHELKEWLGDWHPENFNEIAAHRRFDK